MAKRAQRRRRAQRTERNRDSGGRKVDSWQDLGVAASWAARCFDGAGQDMKIAMTRTLRVGRASFAFSGLMAVVLAASCGFDPQPKSD